MTDPLPSPPDLARWQVAPLEELVDHIVTRYHRRLQAELPALLGAARALAEVGGAAAAAVTERAALLAEELGGHMQREEEVLFPWLLSPGRSTAGQPARRMEVEHRRTVALLDGLREQTAGFEGPAGLDAPGAAAWRAFLAPLARVDALVRAHLALENDVLFPRALRGDAGPPGAPPDPPPPAAAGRPDPPPAKPRGT